MTQESASAATDTGSANFVADLDPGTKTDPKRDESDRDGLKDGEEDRDRNGCIDPMETDPNDADTDHGGVPDGEEAERGTDPLLASDDRGAPRGGGCEGCSAGGGGATSLGLLALLLAAVALRRRGRRSVDALWLNGNGLARGTPSDTRGRTYEGPLGRKGARERAQLRAQP